MASLSLKALSVGRNTAQLQVTLKLTYNSSTREEFFADQILGPSGVSREENLIDYKETTSGGTTTCTYKINLFGLTPGATQTFKYGCTYSVEEYEETVDAYWFWGKAPDSDNWIIHRSESKSSIGQRYLEYKDEGYELEPTSSDDYDTTYRYNGQTAYLYEEISEGWEDYGWEEEEASITLYMRPAWYTFKTSGSPNAGDGWYIDQGIQTLLNNIYNFNSTATAWKKWKNQSSNVTSCSAFSKGNLSAEMINDANAYLGVTTNFKSGDTIRAQIFKDIEGRLNN